VDVSSEVLENQSLIQALVYDGVALPFPDLEGAERLAVAHLAEATSTARWHRSY
jgi:hypothetical protein